MKSKSSKLLKSLFIFLFIFTSINIFAQDSTKHLPKVSEEKRKLNFGYPRYYPHLGLGLVNGERLGGIVQFHENFSAEASYGFVFGAGWSLTDPDNIASIGANVHFRNDIPVFVGIIYSVKYYRPINSNSNNYNSTEKFISINAGYLDLTEIGMQFMGRIGFYVTGDKRQGSNSFLDYINLDIGLGYSF